MEAEAKALAAHRTGPADTSDRPPASVARPANATGTRVPAGTPVAVATAQSLSSVSAVTGQEWTGLLREDLKDEAGIVLAKAGSEVRGRIVLASDGNTLRRRHELEIRVFRLMSASGQPVEVRTTSFLQEGPEAGTKPAIVLNGAKIDFRLASSTVFP